MSRGTLVQTSSQSLHMLLFLLVPAWDIVANELSQQDAACCWCCVRWGLSRCAPGVMNCLFFFLALYTSWSEEKQSRGNPWYNVSNILIDVFSLSFFLILLRPQMHSSYSSCSLLWGAWQSVLYCAVSLDPCMELGIGLCRQHPPCLTVLESLWW